MDDFVTNANSCSIESWMVEFLIRCSMIKNKLVHIVVVGKLFKAIRLRARYVFAAFVVFLAVLTVILWLVESSASSDINFGQFLWTAIFTVVGAGDFADQHPSTYVGKIIVLILSLCGLGIVGWLIAELAGNFVLTQMRRLIGMSEYKGKGDHIVICGWNSRAPIIIREFASYAKKRDVCVITNDTTSPILREKFDSHVIWIQGDFSDEEVLTKEAKIEFAHRVIILANRLDAKTADDIDAKTILTALNIESIGKKVFRADGEERNIYTIVEILNSDNKKYAKIAKVDEIILTDDTVGKIIASCAENKHLGDIFTDLLTSGDKGNEFYTINFDADQQNMTFGDVAANIRSKGAIPIAIVFKEDQERDKDNVVKLNPAENLIMCDVEKIVVICHKDTYLKNWSKER